MKRLILLFFILTISFSTESVMITYETTSIVVSQNSIERFPAYLITDQQLYATGGIVFTYPAGLFTSPPTISATIQTPSITESYTAEVSLEDINSATVMVYVNNSGVLTEAGAGTVTVHFTATGM